MATSAQNILNRASLITGFKMSATTTERLYALEQLNVVVRDVRRRTLCELSSSLYSIPSSTDWYDISAVCGGVQPAVFDSLILRSSGQVRRIKIRQLSDLLNARLTTSDAGVVQIAANLGLGKVGFWPNPSVGDVINAVWVPKATDLTDVTANITSIDDEWQWKVLLPGLVSRMLWRDGKREESKDWRGEYEAVVIEMRSAVRAFLGDEPTIQIGEQGGYDAYPYPDTRRRGY